MPAFTSLLDVDPNKLFEEHTIDEIKNIQKKLQAENERKRVELRTVVGERYRDLIDAADMISNMKVTAEGVIGHIEKMSVRCQELQHQHLIGFKPNTERSTNSQKSAKNHNYSVAIQIKILMDVPEKIWCAVEDENFLLATQLFQLARHINTGLQLHLNAEKDSSNVARWLPIVVQQWASIGPFQESIVQRCQQKLQSHNLTDQEASECLCALALAGRAALLPTFLDLRTAALESALRNERHGAARARLVASLRILVATVTLLHAAFLGEGEGADEGLVWAALKRVTGRSAPPTVALLGLGPGGAAAFLPPVVRDFRPSCLAGTDPVAPSEMRSALSSWLDRVRGLVEAEGAARLRAVATVRGLHAIREEAVGAAPQSERWDNVCQRVMIPRGFNAWESLYQPLLSSRAKQIVTDNWTSILDDLLESLATEVQEVLQDKGQSESDLRWLVWSEAAGDVASASANDGALGLKARAVSPRVATLSALLDKRLGAMLDDLRPWIDGNVDEEARAVRTHLQRCTADNVDRLCARSRAESALGPSAALLVARTLSALPQLCAALRSCADAVCWPALADALRGAEMDAWREWRKGFTAQTDQLVAQRLGGGRGMAQRLQDMPRWDTVSIEEEAEGGRSVRSDIRVPAQPALPLQALLHDCAAKLNAVAPHALPHEIHRELVAALAASILRQYGAALAGEPMAQAQALQTCLDVKYVAALLVPRDSKTLMGTVQELVDKAEDSVDPFDLDVFTPYLQANIKRSVHRTQCLLGVLVAWPEKLAPARMPPASAPEEPNVLALATGCPWLPLLPTAGQPGSRPATAQPPPPAAASTSRKPVGGAKPKTEAGAGEMVRSGAAAFFGAMSTDWFGS